MIVILWTLFLVCFASFYFMGLWNRKRGKTLPGPWPLPLFGTIPQLAMAHSRPDLAIAELSKKYGEIYKLKIGGSELVILSSYEAIRTVLTNKDVMGRDMRGTFSDRNKGKNAGIGLCEGPKWEALRSWTISNLKDYGFNKTSSMESSILEDIESMFAKIDKSLNSDGKGLISVGDWFLVPVVKFIWKMMVGHCNLADEEMIGSLVTKSEAVFKNGLFGVGVANAFPILRHIFPNLTGYTVMMDFAAEGYAVAENLLQESLSQEIEIPQTFLQAFAKKIAGPKTDDPHNCFNEHDFAVVFMDLIQTGSDTSASYLESLVLHMVLYPEVQAKVYEEIQTFIPQGQVAFSDSKSMIYTRAVMLEVHRHTKVAQHYIPRKVSQDVQYKDYIIPKGNVVMTDLHTVFNCPQIWDDPQPFKPERFVGLNGELVNQQHVIPFSVGKRNCIAENVAEVISFLFFTSILRKYELSAVPGEPVPRGDMQVGITSRPYPFSILISKRK